jgi:hypothetical protein
MIRYIHGSHDSLDIDVFYVFDKLPSYKECYDFCSNKEENRNIIVIKDGFVVDCFKGTVDEIQNSLLSTYHLHKQDFDLIINSKVKRNIPLKIIRVIRCILSYFSRTVFKEQVKKALKSTSLKEKINIIKILDFDIVNEFGKNGSKEDIYKTISFQIGQVLGLLNGKEFYTKQDVSNEYKELEKYLYRNKNSDIKDLKKYISLFIEEIEKINYIEFNDIVYFVDYDKKFNLKNEKEVE